MTDRELMQMALDALKEINRTGDTQAFDLCVAPKLIPALRNRLEQPEREWAGLTVEDWEEINQQPIKLTAVLAAEAKLKEKNT